MRLTTADDRRKGFWIAFALAMIALASFGSALLTGCATIRAIENVDK